MIICRTPHFAFNLFSVKDRFPFPILRFYYKIKSKVTLRSVSQENAFKKSKKQWKSLQNSEFFFLGAHRGTALLCWVVPLWAPQKSEIHSFGVIFLFLGKKHSLFRVIFTRLKSRICTSLECFYVFNSFKSDHHFALLSMKHMDFQIYCLNRFKQAISTTWKFTYLEFLTCNTCPHQKESRDVMRIIDLQWPWWHQSEEFII